MKLILIAATIVMASCSSTSLKGEKGENCRLSAERPCESSQASQRMPQAFEYMSQTRR